MITYALVLLTTERPMLIATVPDRGMCEIWERFSEYAMCIPLTAL